MVSRRLGLLLFPLLLQAEQSFEAYKKLQESHFKNEKVKFIDFKKQEDAAFKRYLAQEREAILKYKKKVKAFWPTTDLEDAKKHVIYSQDLRTKSLIDYEKNEVSVSRIDSTRQVSKQQLLHTLKQTLSLNNKKAYEKNALEQDIHKLAKDENYIQDGKIDDQPLLSDSFSAQKLNADQITYSQKGDVHTIRYKLPGNSTFKRSYNYLVAAKSNAQRFKLKAQWLLAIMHSESSFNPMARSHIPAYGLMQIVPRTAGIDSYRFLYNKRRLLSASYLYNTQNNIEIGSAYFHILYYKYLSSIQDPTSRLYCAIAGYNTGAGNVARAFVGTNSVQSAAELINTMSPEQVYDYLLRNLRHEEPKHYLKRVRARSTQYKEIYQL